MSVEPIVDPVFGRMTWNEERECWQGNVLMTPKHAIEINLHWEAEAPPEEELEAWRATYESIRRADREHRLAAAELLLAGNDESAFPRAAKEGLSRESVAAMLTLEAIELLVDGPATLWYEHKPFSSRGYSASAEVEWGEVTWAGFW